MTIARDRWQQHLKTRGAYYRDARPQLAPLHADAPRGRCRRRRTRPGGPGRACSSACPRRAPDPQPARAVPARRAGGPRRVRRRAVAGGPPRRRRAAATRRPDRRFDADALAAMSPRLRPRGGHEGRRGGPALGGRARPMPAHRRAPPGSDPRRDAIRSCAGRPGRRHGPRCRRAVRLHHGMPSPVRSRPPCRRRRPTREETSRCDTDRQPIAIVGIGAIMPDAPDAAAFWANIRAVATRSATCRPSGGTRRCTSTRTRTPRDKTYSKIGGWVRDFAWEPMAGSCRSRRRWPTQMDDGQKWAVASAARGAARRRLAGLDVDPERSR